VLLAALALLVVFLLTPTGCYLSRAGWEEAKILAGRRPIAELVRDPAVDARTRAKLQLVLDARQFAEDSIRLKAEESFTTFSQLESDTLVLVLSGAYPDQLRSYTWWFPIVGRVPYKGYFDFEAAKRARKALADRGFDTNLRPASAFSTLGWFNDPLLSTTLAADSLDLANTVIHELTHTTFYAPGRAVFNESFASMVGSRGAEWFFRSRGRGDLADSVAAQWEDDKVLGHFYARLYRAVDSAFKARPGDDSASRAARIAARDSLYRAARAELRTVVAPQLRTIPPGWAERVRLDNAALLARRVYSTHLDWFDEVYALEGRNVRHAVRRITDIAREHPKDPYDGLRRWIEKAKGEPLAER
jgi:predicted aminopeptidase